MSTSIIFCVCVHEINRNYTSFVVQGLLVVSFLVQKIGEERGVAYSRGGCLFYIIKFILVDMRGVFIRSGRLFEERGANSMISNEGFRIQYHPIDQIMTNIEIQAL